MPDTDARPPKLPARPRTVGGVLDAVGASHGWASLEDAQLDSTTDLTDCDELELSDCVLDGVDLGATVRPVAIELVRCVLTGCDLSQVRLRALHGTRLVDCKLTGTDVSGVRVRDTELERCHLRYVNLRMGGLERVRFAGCVLDDVDFHEATLTDVAFPLSRLQGVNVDRTSFERVDLREATELGITAVTNLRGVVVRPEQVVDLAWVLAAAAGLTVGD